MTHDERAHPVHRGVPSGPHTPRSGSRKRPSGSPAATSTGRSAALVVGFATAVAGLAVIGPGLPLHAGLARPEQWTTWLTEVGPAVAVMAAIRQVGLVLGGYLLVVTSLDLVAHLTRSNVLATMAGCVTVPTVRRLIAGATGAGLAASFTVAALAPGLASARPRPVAAATCPDPARQTNPAYASGRPDGDSCPNLTMRQITPTDATTPAAPTPTPTIPPATIPTPTIPTPTIPMASPTPGPVGSWTIAPGDHLWRVAERTLQAAWGRRPRAEQTAAYLEALIRANRDVLVVSGEPDLVFPGQVFALPAVPAA